MDRLGRSTQNMLDFAQELRDSQIRNAVRLVETGEPVRQGRRRLASMSATFPWT
ncbi:hypothetical protein [Microbacterium aerolatum]|uniref:hypothetical protein n=1 Tax=Microbacterium aerolatum TaxID=153731 RepID=UPI0027D935B7|nr:hypothetical protein [Microbacterium aerolatum]